jgi:hypothetical protein
VGEDSEVKTYVFAVCALALTYGLAILVLFLTFYEQGR